MMIKNQKIVKIKVLKKIIKKKLPQLNKIIK